jgi:hypothetical protein
VIDHDHFHGGLMVRSAVQGRSSPPGFRLFSPALWQFVLSLARMSYRSVSSQAGPPVTSFIPRGLKVPPAMTSLYASRIDASGAFHIPAQFSSAAPFAGGVANVTSGDGKQIRYIDPAGAFVTGHAK